MRIVVPTIGSRGDVQPYVNLCQGLQERGHDVTLATNPTLCSLASSHNVKSTPVGPPVDMGIEGARLMASSFNNMWIGMIRVMKLGARLVEEAFPDVQRACVGADLVVTSDTGSGIAEAEKLGIPWVSVTLQPGRIPVVEPSPSLANRALWGLLGKLLVVPINRSRRRIGAPIVTDLSSMLSQRMILLPVSRHVAPPNPGWPGYVKHTGFWYARSLDGWSPPRELLEFLEAGDRPIAVSLGVMSMSGKQAQDSAQIVLRAVQETGVRAIVQGWDEAMLDREVPRTVFRAGSMPHSWLFEQVSTIVHHGGFGTTAAALRAGVPSIVIPHVIDQFYWGNRVFELGVGPKPISRGRLNANNLAEAIIKTRDETHIREKAKHLGAQICSEPDGVSAAVSIIEELSL